MAVFASGVIGWPAAAAIDTLFLLVFAAVAAREVIAGRNRRNLKVVVLVSVLALVNLCFHWRSAAVSRPDAIVMALSGVALASWIVWPEATAVGLGLVTAGLANLWRLSRWHGWRARADRLVLILHVGFLFAALLWCLGFLVIYAPLLALPAAPPAPSPGGWPRLVITEPRR